MARFGLLLAVAIGGAAGSLARWGAVSAVDGQTAVVVFGCNVLGSLILGALLGQREGLSERTFGLIGVGFAGGFTTFSTFAVDVASRLDDGLLLSAAGNGFGTPIAAVVAAGVGYRFSRIGGAKLLAGRRGRTGRKRRVGAKAKTRLDGRHLRRFRRRRS